MVILCVVKLVWFLKMPPPMGEFIALDFVHNAILHKIEWPVRSGIFYFVGIEIDFHQGYVHTVFGGESSWSWRKVVVTPSSSRSQGLARLTYLYGFEQYRSAGNIQSAKAKTRHPVAGAIYGRNEHFVFICTNHGKSPLTTSRGLYKMNESRQYLVHHAYFWQNGVLNALRGKLMESLIFVLLLNLNSIILRSVISCDTTRTDSNLSSSLYSGMALTCITRLPNDSEGKGISVLTLSFVVSTSSAILSQCWMGNDVSFADLLRKRAGGWPVYVSNRVDVWEITLLPNV